MHRYWCRLKTVTRPQLVLGHDYRPMTFAQRQVVEVPRLIRDVLHINRLI